VRARAFGTFSAVAGTANMIGYAAGGLLLQVFAPRVVIFGTGLLGLCVALVFLLPHLARRGSATVVNHGFAAAAPRRAHPVP
jgi:MFS family permease